MPEMGQVEATVISECGRFKVEIERRSSGAFQLLVYKWFEEYVEGYGKVGEFWDRVGAGATFTDTIERAKQLAKEKLQALI
jgi:hypothetical protein